MIFKLRLAIMGGSRFLFFIFYIYFLFLLELERAERGIMS